MNDNHVDTLLARALDDATASRTEASQLADRVRAERATVVRAEREPSSRRPTRRRKLGRSSMSFRRIPRMTIGAVSAVAAGIALIVALAPGGDGGGTSSRVEQFVGPDTAVARELVRVGDVAGDVQWGPLDDDEYFHFYSSSVPGSNDGARSGGMRSSYEVWLDQAGNGQMLSVMASVDPRRDVPFEESLTKPDEVSLTGWPKGDKPGFQRGWLRTPTGFEKNYDSASPRTREPDTAASMDPKTTMRQFWGVTFDQLDALPTEGGPTMDAAVEDLLKAYIDDPTYRSNRIPNGAFGMTMKQTDREERIQYAVQLLGTAPLPPEARRSLYRWLARQPGAQLERDVKDAIGRPGVRITFTNEFEAKIPARSITVAELIQEAIDAGAELDPDVSVTRFDLPKTNEEMVRRQHEDFNVDVTLDERIDVPAHTESRTWRIWFVVDPDTGQLMQQQLKMVKRASATIPELARQHNGDGIQILETGGSGSSEMSTGSNLYIARDRAPLDQPSSLVCTVEPTICRP
ncbi:MAG: hypothetical protein JWL76_2280 [Thermoleophilia bacterium]|nr:hypothetical protein [Thermoleophilia bacterium]